MEGAGDDDDADGDAESGDGDRMQTYLLTMRRPSCESLSMRGVAVVGDGARRSVKLPKMWPK